MLRYTFLHFHLGNTLFIYLPISLLNHTFHLYIYENMEEAILDQEKIDIAEFVSIKNTWLGNITNASTQ